jgi:RHS repeat-associated protein
MARNARRPHKPLPFLPYVDQLEIRASAAESIGPALTFSALASAALVTDLVWPAPPTPDAPTAGSNSAVPLAAPESSDVVPNSAPAVASGSGSTLEPPTSSAVPPGQPGVLAADLMPSPLPDPLAPSGGSLALGSPAVPPAAPAGGGGGGAGSPGMPAAAAGGGAGGSASGGASAGGGQAAVLPPSSPLPPPSMPSTGTALTRSAPLTPSAPASPAAPSSTPHHPALAPTYAQQPLAFVPNAHITDPQVQFLSAGAGYTFFVTPDEAVLSLARPSSPSGRPFGAPPTTIRPTTHDVVGVHLLGANASAAVTGVNELPARANYFTGNQRSAWQSDLTQYSRVRVQNVYPGIDAYYYGTQQGQVEFDFVVSPGASPQAITLDLQGLAGVSLDGQGNLMLQTAGGQLLQQAPSVYQTVGGVRQGVSGHYVLSGPHQVRFQVGAYNPALPLVIDPILVYGTYLGGNGDDQALALAVDGAGNSYLAGVTASADFPVLNPFQATFTGVSDAFVSKFGPTGGLMYSTFLGGSNMQQANGIAVDLAGNAYITGSTNSSNFPTTPGAYQTSWGGSGSQSAFVASLNPTGDALRFSTYVHGSGSAPQVSAWAIAVDAAGTPYITGDTDTASNFPTTAGAAQTTAGGGSSDAFVLHLDAKGSTLQYATLEGGSAADSGRGIAVDDQGNAFVTGFTASSNFPVPGGFQTSFGGVQSGYVSKLNASGSAWLWSSYIGGSGSASANAIALDVANNAFVAGSTATGATPFPTTAGAYQTSFGGGALDGFVLKVTAAGSLGYATLLGGSSSDSAYALTVDGNSQVTVVGATQSSNFPTLNPLSGQGSLQGNSAAFVTTLNAAGSGLLFSSYVGGSADSQAHGVGLDAANNIYLAGWTTATNFPVTGNAFQGTNHGGTDAFLAKILPGTPPPAITAISPDTGTYNNDQITQSQNLILSGTAAPGATVTLSRSGVGVIGPNIAADPSTGAWSFDYRATTLPEGTYDFTATATLNGVTSLPSPDFLVTVDLTPPAITVSVPASSSSLRPPVRVTASDLNGLPNNTIAVTLDVDLNNDGQFTDAGESGYATGTLTNGTALILLPTLPGVGTYQVRARLTDLAGNAGTSLPQTFQVNTVAPPLFTGVSPDTGVSNSDQITSSQHLTLNGTATPGATVTISRADMGVVGTATANATTGLWSFDYSAVTLAEGAYTFTATATVNGQTSVPSAPLPVTIDLTAPTVALTLASPPSTRAPQVSVTASDALGLPNGTPVALDVDLNNDGQFTDPGEMNYASGMLINGTAVLTLPALPGAGPYGVRARVSDLAGNQATSTPLTVTVTNTTTPTFTGIVPDTGVSASDQITYNPHVTLNGTAPPGAVVSLTRVGVGVIGTTSANPTTGAWSFDYTGTTLPEGVTSFTATNVTSSSPPSPPFAVTVDLTPPAVSLSVPAQTSSLTPQVQVTASDLNPLPPGTAVALDVDLNGDGQFSDTGEMNYATGTLSNGTALITLRALPGTGSYSIRARVSDLAGNERTSAVQGFSVVSTVPLLSASVLDSDPQSGMDQEQLGNLQLVHALDLDQSPGTSQGGNPALVYNSRAVSVRPLIQVALATSPTAALPATVALQLTWNGTPQSTVSFNTDGHARGDVLIGAVQVASPVSSTGRYAWSVRVALPGPADTVLSGTAFVVVQDNSPYGPGWTFSGTDQLISIPGDSNGPAGQLRLFGSGGWRFYQDTSGGSFLSPPEDNGTLVRHSDGSFTYTTPDNVRLTFNASGQQTGWLSADGQESLSYTYTGSQLTGMTAIDGATTTFTYPSGLLSSIVTLSRTVSIGRNGSNLASITNPDGGVDSFTYDGNNHLITQTFANLQNSWAYDSGSGTLQTITWGAGQTATTSTLSSAVIQGLSTLVTGPAQASLSDALGNVTSWQLDSRARPLAQTDANGAVSQWQRDAAGRVLLAVDPLQHATSYLRDAQGYVTLERLPDGNTRTYQYQSAFHALIKSVDERNKTTTYTWDSAGHLNVTTDALNEQTTNNWTTSGLLQSVTDANNHTTTYTWDSATRRLLKVTDANTPAGNTLYGYDGNGNGNSLTDPLQQTTSWVNDALGRPTQETDALNHSQSWVYNGAGLETSFTDKLGVQEKLFYDNRGLQTEEDRAAGTLVEEDTLSSYDADGRESAARNADGYWSTQAYDSVDEVIQSTNALGGVSLWNFDLAGENTAQRDELGRWTKHSFNARGWETTTTDAAGHDWTTTYNAVGAVATQKSPLNITYVSNSYDDLERLSASVDALGHGFSYTFDPAGNEQTVTDARNLVTQYTLDALNRVSAETDAYGTSQARTVTLGYDADSNLKTQTDALTHTVSWVYDKVNQPTEYHDGLNHIWVTGYDPVGDVTSSTDPLSKTTYVGLDALHRPVQTTDPLGHSDTQIEDAEGQEVGTLDGDGHLSKKVYDPLGRNTFDIDADGNKTEQRYDAASNLSLVIDASGNATSFVVDALNQVLVTIDAKGNKTTNTYDVDERLTATLDRDGRQKLYGYDNADRLTTETWKDSNNNTVNTKNYTYNEDNQVLTAGDQNGTYTDTYDNLTRLATQQNPFGQTLTYTYDAADHPTGVADSAGGSVGSSYDAADRLTSRTFSGSGQPSLRMDLGYDNRNDLTSETRYADLNGTQLVGTSTDTYDDAGRLTGITHKNNVPATIDQFTYGYDAANQVTSESSQQGPAHTYGYDKAGQISSDTVNATTNTYTWDKTGNRANPGYQTGTENELTTDGTWNDTYDNEGNLIKKSKGANAETWTYGYDHDNHMVWAEDHNTDGGAATIHVDYKYDVFGQRIEKDVTQNSVTTKTRFAYDRGNIWADLDGNNNLVTRRFYLDAVDALFAQIGANGVEWYLTDHLGSVRDLLNASGAIIDHLEYDPFGNVTTETVPSAGDRYKFTGREYDTETGLQLNGARYYDARTGRWTSQDPMGFDAGDSNLYRYVKNGPTDGMDPSGLWQIIRNGQPTATAIAEKGKRDTIKSLAELIGLDVAQKDDWLRPVNNTPIDKVLTPGEKFSIPNTVVAIYAFNAWRDVFQWTLGGMFCGFDASVGRLERVGFKVVEHNVRPTWNNTKPTPDEICKSISQLSRKAELHGFWYMGHGEANMLRLRRKNKFFGGCDEVLLSWQWIARHLKYRLALVVANACESEGSKALATGTKGAIHKFFEGRPYAFQAWPASWIYARGEQGTKSLKAGATGAEDRRPLGGPQFQFIPTDPKQFPEWAKPPKKKQIIS